MKADILERVKSRVHQHRLDKECGKSFIPDKSKCSKPNILRHPKTTPSNPANTILGFMGVLGVGAAAYLAIKAKYRAGFDKSAEEAQAIAQKIRPGTIKAKQHTIVFGVGGMAYGKANDATRTGDRIVTAFKMAFSNTKGKDLKMVSIDNNDTNVAAGTKPGFGPLDVAKLHFGNITNGRNKTAVNLAAQVIAYGDKYPDRPLVMAGHSYGGMVVHEAQEIIRRARPNYEKRLKSLAFGTQYFGLTQSFGESHTIGSPADPFTAIMPTQNLKSFSKVKGHAQGDYFRDPEVQDFVRSILYRDKKDATPRLDKACGKSFISDKAKCYKFPAARQAKSESAEDSLTRVQTAQKNPDFKKLPDSLKTIVIGAAMVGLSVAAYQKVREQYRAGFEKSAQMAEKISKHVAVPDIPDSKKAITFTTGGFYGYEGEAAARKGEDYLAYKMKTEILGDKTNPGGDHHIVTHRNTKFNTTPSPVGGPLSHVRDTYEHYATMLRTTLGKGRNPESVKLAAEVMAYHQKYPDKEINLVGHSAGGMISHEAAEILNKRNIKVKIVNLGTGHFGLTEKVGESHTVAFHEDMYLKTIPGTARDAAWVGNPSAPLSPDMHRVRAYMNEESSRAKIRELLKTKQRKDGNLFFRKTGVIKLQKKDSLTRFSYRNDAPNNCEHGESCGETCIDPKEECNIKNVSPEIDAAINDLSDAVLGAIPGYGQIIAAKKLLVSGQAALRATKNPDVPLSQKVVMGAIILAGISYLGYQKYRDYRQSAVDESANIAKTTAKGLPVTNTSRDQITFTLDGTGKGDKQVLKAAMTASNAFGNHEIIDFSESLEDPMTLPDDMSDRDRKIAREAEAAKNHFGALTTGRNSHAVDLAAQVLAYQAKYPLKRINIVAHGAGAQVAMEAADIVKKANTTAAQKLKVVNLQAPDYGIYDSVPGTKTVASDHNPSSLLPMKNKITFGVEDPGDGTGFFKNRRSLAYIKGHLEGTDQDVRTTYTERQSQDEPVNARTLPPNVPRLTMVTAENKPVERSVDRQMGMFEIQEYEKKKSQLQNNVNSTQGQLNRLYAEMETAGSDRLRELEEAATHAVRTLGIQKEKLQQHEQSYKGPKLKTDSAKVAIAALAGAAVGAGLHHLISRGHTSRKKPHCTKGDPCGNGCAPPGTKCQDKTPPESQSPMGVHDVPPEALKTDPKRFQYKLAHNEVGASGSLTEVKKWNPDIGGVLQVWKDPADGHTYVVNGHNRHDLAKRTGAETVTVRYLQVNNAAEARAVGALTNIAEGRGNSIDAAKFFRDTKKSREQLEAVGIPMREKIATEGLAIANLNDGLFDRVVQGSLPIERAAVIGASGISHEEQSKLMSLVDRRTVGGKPLNNDTIKELADMVRDAPRSQSAQMSLFGADDASESLAIQKAELIATLRNQLRGEKKLFGTVSRKRAATTLAKGGNVIDMEQSRQISEGAAHVLGIFDALKGKRGPLSERINDAVVRISNGEKPAAVRTELYNWVARELPATLKRSAA